MIKRIVLPACAVIFATALSAQAQLQLPALFSDNMVLQQGTRVTVWGWADDGEVVTVRFRGQKVSATAHNLKWSVQLHSLKAGGPDALTITAKSRTLQFTNVMVGEVWLCSGQSN